MPLQTHFSFISELTSTVPQGGIWSVYLPSLPFMGKQNLCARTNNAFSPILEVCTGMVSHYEKRKKKKVMVQPVVKHIGMH